MKHRPKRLEPSFRALLIDDLRNGCEKRAIAAKHGVSVPTVSRVLHTAIGLHETWSTKRADRIRDEARDLWNELLRNYQQLGLKLMRAMNPAVYAWLYRNDRLWLTAHLPTKQSKRTDQRASSVRWDDRDGELSLAVKRAAYSLLHEKGLYSLKLWQLYQIVPELKAKLSALHRLPLTQQALEAVLNKPFKNQATQSHFGDSEQEPR